MGASVAPVSSIFTVRRLHFFFFFWVWSARRSRCSLGWDQPRCGPRAAVVAVNPLFLAEPVRWECPIGSSVIIITGRLAPSPVHEDMGQRTYTSMSRREDCGGTKMPKTGYCRSLISSFCKSRSQNRQVGSRDGTPIVAGIWRGNMGVRCGFLPAIPSPVLRRVGPLCSGNDRPVAPDVMVMRPR